VTYRLYSRGDFAQLYAIEETCFAPPLRFSRQYMRQLVNARNAATWIAEEDGRLAGFAIVDWTQEIGGVAAYIQTIEVAPGQRGRGVGGELLRKAEGSARAAKAVLIWLHVDAENRAAISLYEASGYRCERRQANYYGRGRNALVYAKALATL
jgi:ribosomal protein S18 acetylase RimI-like enzyme